LHIKQLGHDITGGKEIFGHFILLLVSDIAIFPLRFLPHTVSDIGRLKINIRVFKI